MKLELIADERSKRAEINLSFDELLHLRAGIQAMLDDLELYEKSSTWYGLSTKSMPRGDEELVFICHKLS